MFCMELINPVPLGRLILFYDYNNKVKRLSGLELMENNYTIF